MADRFTFTYSDDFRKRCLAALSPESRNRQQLMDAFERGSICVSWAIHDEIYDARLHYPPLPTLALNDLLNEWESNYYKPALLKEADEKEAALEAGRKQRTDLCTSALRDIKVLRHKMNTADNKAALQRLRDFVLLARSWMDELP